MKSLFTAGALALSLLAAPAAADPATVMAPGGPGGGYDAMARLPFQAMQEAGIFTDGAQFTNKGGAGGTIGLAEFVNNNKGNDNAVMSMGAILVGGILLNNSPVTLDDVTPLVRLINDTGAVAVPPDSPIKTVDDFVAELKKDPGAFPIGGGSAGGVDHIAAALIAKEAGAAVDKLNYIPYPSGAEVVAAIAGGTIDGAISGVSEFKQFADAGRLRIIAVTGEERVPGIDAPTLKEAGLNVSIGNWRGIIGAPEMSQEGRQMWLDRFAKMHESDAWKKVLEAQSWEDAYLAGDEFEAFLDEEKTRQEQVLKDVGLLK
ncbi:MAG: C4-dicarboxylate transporter substrate-binding protein [Rhizobiaceae bacterium]|jgi:putative tricarboxylic transport membrane protein|nr:C4-dicarboxylate transporter substrate-binding protein [Rhizobiaceae bacterium]